MMKASNHRKRHNPAGPAGVWYSAQQQLRARKNQQGMGIGSHRKSSRHGSSMEQDETNDTLTNDIDNDDIVQFRQHMAESQQPSLEDVTFSPVWASMMQSLGLTSPHIPSHLSLEQRYRLLRPHFPSNYVLLYEIVRGEHDFCVANEDTRLLVLVHDVSSHIHHNIWTVELQDESGATVKAWMEPKHVQEQMEEHQGLSMIRPGVVWMLNKVSMIAVPNEQEEKVERMLLVSGRHVEQIWTPEQVNDEQDDAARQKYMLSASQPEKPITQTRLLEEVSQESSWDLSQDQRKVRLEDTSIRRFGSSIQRTENISPHVPEDESNGIEQYLTPTRTKKGKATSSKKKPSTVSRKSKKAKSPTNHRNSPVEQVQDAGKRIAKSPVVECMNSQIEPLSGAQPDSGKEPNDDLGTKSQDLVTNSENSKEMSANLTNPQHSSNSSLWDIQDSTILDALDDSDDDSIAAPNLGTKETNRETSRTQESVDSTTYEERRVSIKLQVAASDNNKTNPSSEREQPSSIFDASNLEALDMVDFSDSD